MRKAMLLASASLLAAGVAFADGEEASKSGWSYSAAVGWTDMEMPDHANASFVIGPTFEPFTLQADVDGVSYGFGLAYESPTGWRFGGGLRFADLDGASSQDISFANALAFRRGRLSGFTEAAGAPWSGFAGPTAGAQSLDVTVDTSAVSVSLGRALVHMLRADLVVSYDLTDTAYRNTLDLLDTGAFRVVGVENTDFESRTVEFAGRLSTGFGLTSDLSISLGGSGGWALRDVEMQGRQRFSVNNILASNTSIKVTDDDLTGFIGRLDASLNYAISPGMAIGAGAVYVYDEVVPVFVPPTYTAVAATTGTAATFDTESHTSLTYGVRLSGKF